MAKPNLPNHIDIKAAAKRLGINVKTAYNRCSTGKLPGACKYKGRWHIPESTIIRLCKPKQYKDHFTVDERIRISLSKREEAIRKLGIVVLAEKSIVDYVKNVGRYRDVMAAFASNFGISERTLRRWIQARKQKGIIGLVDKRGGDHSKDEQSKRGSFRA